MSTGAHHRDPLTGGELAIDNAHVGDNTAVGVVDGVEDHCSGRCIGITDGRRHQFHHLVEKLIDPKPGLRTHLQDVINITANDVRELRGVFLGLGGG